ncbi:MAG TPA: hypothetical protein VJ656_07095 [Pyrinomonadaceae bacterium]|nr:hypothetical protein [Pyrinomonadaceae bacterium]
MKQFSILVAIVVIACSFVVRAQQPQEPSVSSQPTDKKTQYLLETYITPRLGPSYFPLNGPKEKSGSAFFSRFVRTDAQPESWRLPIRGVRLEPLFNGETVDVRVTVLRGNEGYEEEELVHVYQVAVGEQKSLSHLRQLGIEPFLVRLLTANPPLPPQPDFRNFTKSIEIVGVRREHTPASAYRITLRNVSDKSVSTLKVDVTSNGQEGPIALPDGLEGRALIEPGGLTDVYILALVAVPHGNIYVPGTRDSYRINIRSVSFTDSSFEGEEDQACSFEAQIMGERLWLRGIIAFIDQELANANFENELEAAKRFNEKVSTLRHKLDESERDKPSSASANCPKPAKNATLTARQMNLLIIRDVDRFIADNPAPGSFKSWLEEKRTRYTAWLARL